MSQNLTEDQINEIIDRVVDKIQNDPATQAKLGAAISGALSKAGGISGIMKLLGGGGFGFGKP